MAKYLVCIQYSYREPMPDYGHPQQDQNTEMFITEKNSAADAERWALTQGEKNTMLRHSEKRPVKIYITKMENVHSVNMEAHYLLDAMGGEEE